MPKASPPPQRRRAVPAAAAALALLASPSAQSASSTGPTRSSEPGPHPPPGTTTRISLGPGGVQGNGFSLLASISADGRFVVFLSAADNLVPDDTNGRNDVFVHDRDTGVTVRANVDSEGNVANSFCYDPRISADGRVVIFDSLASNLVAEDTNGLLDVFVHDLETGVTKRASMASDGTQPDGHSGPSAVSGNGRFVAFASHAGNLVPSDRAKSPTPPFFATDVFVHDLETGVTTKVSVDSRGASGSGSSSNPSVSHDGRFITYTSTSRDLVPDDTNNAPDVFVYDQELETTTRVSVDSGGGQANDRSFASSISRDGRHVAFVSDATNLVPGDTNGVTDVFVHDRETGSTTRVSVDSNGDEGDGPGFDPSISPDGRFVAFLSAASDLVPGDTNGADDVFLHDRWRGTTTLVSKSSRHVRGNAESSLGVSAISTGGRHVAFASSSDNLAPGDTNGKRDVFVHEPPLPEAPAEWIPLGGPADAGAPRLAARGRLRARSTVSFSLSDAPPRSLAVLSLSPDLWSPAPEARSWPPSALALEVATDAAGSAAWAYALPAALPAGTTVRARCLVFDARPHGRSEPGRSLAVSNAVRGTVE